MPIDVLSAIIGGVYTLVVFTIGWGIGYSTASESGKLEAYEEMYGDDPNE
jgi:hypothetical protein